jgi:hypothetical protein
MAVPFRDSKETLARANEHLQSLESAFAAYFAGKWYDCSYSKKAGLEVTILGSPKSLRTILSDAIHNMRSALDIAAVEAVTMTNGNPKDVYFPFANLEENFEERMKRTNFNRAEPKFQDIAQAARPYVDGNLLLRAVHELDVEYKHIRLIKHVANMSTPALKLKLDANGSPKGFAENQLEFELDPTAKPTVHFMFPETCLVGGREVLATTTQMFREVETVIEKFVAAA